MTSLIERQIASILAEIEPEVRRSRLLDYLPALYAGDDFLNRFLWIFEDTLTPLQQQAQNLHYYFDPLTAPAELVGWLATWVNLVLDDSWPIELRRVLIHNAADLYSRRGTRRGLLEYLKLYTGTEPEISEYSDGMRLGAETFLGVNTKLAGRERHSFTVTLRLSGLSDEELYYKEANVRRIIETEKPAHTAYRLRILTDNPARSGPSAAFNTAGLPPLQKPPGTDADNPAGPMIQGLEAYYKQDEGVSGAGDAGSAQPKDEE